MKHGPKESGGVLKPVPPLATRATQDEKPEGSDPARAGQDAANLTALHRGEPLFGWLATFAASRTAGLSSNALFIWLRDWAATVSDGLPAAIRVVSTFVLAAIAIAACNGGCRPGNVESRPTARRLLGRRRVLPTLWAPSRPPCFGNGLFRSSPPARIWLDDPLRPGRTP